MANRIRNGTRWAKILSEVCVSSTLPIKPPKTLTGTKRPSQGLIEVKCSRKPKMLPAVPIISATVLVAFATTGGVPKNNSTGKVRMVPPPAMELIMPAMAAARARPMISVSVMNRS